MSSLWEKNFRPSDLLLDRLLNPARDPEIGGVAPDYIIEACGIIPDFFARACLESDPLTLDQIAEHMDNQYQFGGFKHPFGGTVTAAGVYQSNLEPDDEPDLPPFARFLFHTDDGGFECFVYPYGIVAIRDRSTSQTKVARFD